MLSFCWNKLISVSVMAIILKKPFCVFSHSIHSIRHNSRSFTFWWGKTFTGMWSFFFLFCGFLSNCKVTAEACWLLQSSQVWHEALYFCSTNGLPLKQSCPVVLNCIFAYISFYRQSLTLILVYIINKGKFIYLSFHSINIHPCCVVLDIRCFCCLVRPTCRMCSSASSVAAR